MRKSLLMLLMLLVSIVSFADSHGSGIASATDISQKGVAYEYSFTESAGNVRFTITPNGAGVVGYVTPTNIEYNIGTQGYATGDEITWENLSEGTIIRLTCWWAVAGGRSTTPEISYKVGAAGGEVQTLNSIALDKPIMGLQGNVNVIALDVDGLTYSGDIVYSISGGAALSNTGNTLTISAENTGNYTITATAGDVTKTAVITLIEPATTPTEPSASVFAYYSDAYNATLSQNGIADKNWNWKYNSYTEIDVAAGDKACLVIGAGTFGLNRGAKDVTEYTKFCADIYVTEDVQGHIEWEGSEFRPAMSLKAGWNHIEESLNGSANATWLQFYIGSASSNNHNFVIDNVYVSKSTDIAFSISVSDNVAMVKGRVTAADVEAVNSVDAMYIDMTGVTEIVDAIVLEPKNPNALIGVTGTHGAANAASALYDNLSGTRNMVIKDTYLFPVNKLQFIDANGVKQWMGEGSEIKFISTGSTGYKVTRSLKAKAFSTVYATAIVNNLPEGVTVWQAVGYDGNNITFNKINNIAAFLPCVVYNSNNEETKLSFEGTGDFDLFGWSTVNVAPHSVGTAAIQGNFKEFITDGTQWILQNAAADVNNGSASVVFNKANGAVVGPFRAYFTGLTAGAGAKFNGLEDVVTGINSVDANTGNDHRVYSINGTEVSGSNLAKGVYIKNGRKFVVK